MGIHRDRIQRAQDLMQAQGLLGLTIMDHFNAYVVRCRCLCHPRPLAVPAQFARLQGPDHRPRRCPGIRASRAATRGGTSGGTRRRR